MHSDWSKLVTRLVVANQNALFQRSVDMLKFVDDIGSQCVDFYLEN